MGRRAKLNISECNFQKYLLNNYVDKDGDKVSDRELWSSDKFMNDTGLFRKDKHSTKKVMVSMGTISYWKKKLGVDEKCIYHYHTTITKKISEPFESWSRLNNAGHSKKKVTTDLARRSDLVKILNLSSEFKKYSVNIIMDYMRSIWRDTGMNVEQETQRVMELLDSKGGGN